MTNTEQLKLEVQSYAKTLADVVSGNDAFKELAECADTDEYDFDSEYDRLRWYFEDVLDVEFRVDSRLEYRGAVVTLALGGPTITFNTRKRLVQGYWGEYAEAFVDIDAAEAVDDYLEEEFELIRESF